MERLPFRYLHPTFFAGLLDDPVLLLRVRPLGRALLVDCGQLHHLAKRALKSVSTLFVSHAHMDHFMGIDTFIRNVHVAPRTFELFGPPGIAARLAHKLAGYDWNLAEAGWCTFRVREVSDKQITTYEFPGPERFELRFAGRQRREGSEFFHNRYLTVSGALCDHKIPSLTLRFDERPPFAIDQKRLAAARLLPGPWLQELKRRFCRDALAGPLTVPRKDGTAEVDAAMLYRRIRRQERPASVGYLTDLGFGDGNRARLRTLLRGVTLLVCECTYLRGEKAKARASGHLCSDDVNELLDELRPAYCLPMHLSKAYLGRHRDLYAELQPPPDTVLLQLPAHLTPRPLLAGEADARLRPIRT